MVQERWAMITGGVKLVPRKSVEPRLKVHFLVEIQLMTTAGLCQDGKIAESEPSWDRQ
jgi:hypothetical protein